MFMRRWPKISPERLEQSSTHHTIVIININFPFLGINVDDSSFHQNIRSLEKGFYPLSKVYV